MSDILPCPVCGKMPEERVCYQGFVVECGDDDCENDEPPLHYVKTAELAVENWNDFVRNR